MWKIVIMMKLICQYHLIYAFNDNCLTDNYTIEVQEKSKGQVVVTNFGVSGRICSNGWGDEEARVLCRSKGYLDGKDII